MKLQKILKSIMKHPNLITFLVLIQVSLISTSAYGSVEHASSFKSSCGTGKQVAARLGECIRPVFDIAIGKVQMPKNDTDLLGIAERFVNAEKCIRGTSRECLDGFHKATTSTVASSSRRYRTSQWKTAASRARYYEPCACSIKLAKEELAIYENHTAIVQAIRDNESLKAEQKLTKVCCVFQELDHSLIHLYDGVCPESTNRILDIIHALTEDARNTVCVSPKCHNILKPYADSKYKPPQQFIEPILEVLFSLSVAGDP